MYSQPWRPTPSTTAVAPELRTAKRSPARPRTKSSPEVAPYSVVLPTAMLRGRLVARVRRRPHDDARARQALADVVVGLPLEVEHEAADAPGAEALPGGAA